MSCNKPLTAYQGGAANPRTGKRPIYFKWNYGFQKIQVPCGQCMGCRLEKTRQWAIRIENELRMHDGLGIFATLTYDDDHLDTIQMYEEDTPDGRLTLNKVDLQKFLKRLRKEVAKDGKKIRFFACGEYGESYGRPHYHVIIFGWKPSDGVLHSSCGQQRLYISEIITRIWGKGHTSYGNVTFESAAYVAGYATKKVTGKMALGHYGDRSPEFGTMSRRQGIGYRFFQKYREDLYSYDRQVIRGKVVVKPPKYYDKLFEQMHPDRMEVIKRDRLLNASKAKQETLDKRELMLKHNNQLKKRKFEHGNS